MQKEDGFFDERRWKLRKFWPGFSRLNWNFFGDLQFFLANYWVTLNKFAVQRAAIASTHPPLRIHLPFCQSCILLWLPTANNIPDTSHNKPRQHHRQIYSNPKDGTLQHAAQPPRATPPLQYRSGNFKCKVTEFSKQDATNSSSAGVIHLLVIYWRSLKVATQFIGEL